MIMEQQALDKQVIEIMGRNRLIDELLRANLEVALPMRDHGVDLIAYVDSGENVTEFRGCPIQMKAATQRAFSISTKYKKFPNIVIAYVWGVSEDADPAHKVTYALTYDQAEKVAVDMRWTNTTSWKEKNWYSTSQPSQELIKYLDDQGFRMTSERWVKLIMTYR
jgi:hypothetical protein